MSGSGSMMGQDVFHLLPASLSLLSLLWGSVLTSLTCYVQKKESLFPTVPAEAHTSLFLALTGTYAHPRNKHCGKWDRLMGSRGLLKKNQSAGREDGYWMAIDSLRQCTAIRWHFKTQLKSHLFLGNPVLLILQHLSLHLLQLSATELGAPSEFAPTFAGFQTKNRVCWGERHRLGVHTSILYYMLGTCTYW